MLNIHKFFLLSCAVLLTIACSSNTPRASTNALPPDLQEKTFDDNQSALRSLNSWQFDGQFSSRTAQRTDSATISWLQERDQYLIKISGPLQQGTVYLRGNPSGISYKDAKGNVDSAKNPEALLRQHTGYQLPISSLRYWILGRPDPRYPYELVISPAGDMGSLKQQGWEIKYDIFQFSAPYRLPSEITLTHPDVEIFLKIHQWNTDLAPR